MSYKEGEPVLPLPNSEITIVGHGAIGDKAQELVDKTPTLRRLGFSTPPRIVLAEDFFSDFFQRNHIGPSLSNSTATPDTQKNILRGQFNHGQYQLFESIVQHFSPTPLIIRSSAVGDARGTGIYTSEVAGTSFHQFKNALRRVLASYFSQSAEAFRKDAHLAPGFGVIIEPLIGQTIVDQDYEDDTAFAPLLSGTGYSSNPRENKPYIRTVPGFGGGVQTRDTERMTYADLEPHENLFEYIYAQKTALYSFVKQRGRLSALIEGGPTKGLDAQIYISPSKFLDASISYSHMPFPREFYSLDIRPLFLLLQNLETTWGKPQYIEWAVTKTAKSPAFWITQIASIEKSKDTLHFIVPEHPDFSGHTVKGTGTKQCSKIVLCWNTQDLGRLYELNRENTNYILIFSSRLTTQATKSRERLQYKDCSNAAVFLEIPDVPHAGDPQSHIEGLLDSTGKFFAVLDYFEGANQHWEMFHEDIKEYGLEVAVGNFTVLASEKDNELYIYRESNQ